MQFKNINLSNYSENLKNLISGSLWNFLGMLVSKIIMLLLSIYLVNQLGVEIFGKWGVIRSTSSIFTILLGFGISVSAVRFVSEFYQKDVQKVGGVIGIGMIFSVLVGLILTIIFFYLSDTIVSYFIKDRGILVELRISSFFLFFIAVNGMLSGVIAGFKVFKYTAIVNSCACIVGAPIIYFLSKDYSLKGLVFGYLVYYFLLFLGFFISYKILLKKFNVKVSFRNYKTSLPVLYSHNFPSILSGGIGGISMWFVSIYVARMDGGYKIIGINNAVKIIQNVFMEFAAQIDLPILTFITSTKDKIAEKLNQFTPIVFVSFLILPIVWFPELASFLFKKNQFEGESFLLIISLTMITVYIMIFKRGMGRSIISKDLVWWGVYENIFWSFVLLTLIYFLVPRYGSLGYALSFSVSYITDLIVIMPFYVNKGLINKVFAYSLEILVSWIILFIGVINIFNNTDITSRIVTFSFFMPLQFFLLKRINSKI